MTWHPGFSQLSDLDPDDAVALIASMAPDLYLAVTADPAVERCLLRLAAAVDRFITDAADATDGGAA